MAVLFFLSTEGSTHCVFIYLSNKHCHSVHLAHVFTTTTSLLTCFNTCFVHCSHERLLNTSEWCQVGMILLACLRFAKPLEMKQNGTYHLCTGVYKEVPVCVGVASVQFNTYLQRLTLKFLLLIDCSFMKRLKERKCKLKGSF